MQKKKLLITVGAGASIDFGLPSVTGVNTLFSQCALTSHALTNNSNASLYSHCYDEINKYYNGQPKAYLRKEANFEEILYQLNILISHLSDPEYQHGANALVDVKQLPQVLHYGQKKNVDGDMVAQLTSRLMDELVDHFIGSCKVASQQKATEIQELGKFLSALKNKFDIGIITLNYDNLVTQAVPSLFTGFDSSGRFDPMSVYNRKDWNFIYHLHGSVHFEMTRSAHNLHGITWASAPAKGQNHATGRNRIESTEGTSYPMSPLIAGYGKTMQLLRQPFRTYFSQINRLVHEADSLLFLGYGFNDQHLNVIFSEVRDQNRPVVVVDWAGNNQDPLPFREDLWSHNLFKTIPGNASSMSRKGGSSPAVISELKANNELEVSTDPNYPLAVWYNGMLEACRNPQVIIDNL